MRLAFSISGQRTAPQAVAIATLAEHRRYDEIWLTEDYCERGAFAVAGAVAAATERVTIGLGVLNPWTRHPALTAMEFAALDEVAGGRAVLGMGASNPHWMQTTLGIPFERPLPRLRESVEVLRAVLAGEPVEHNGETYRISGRLAFAPVRTRPPIVLGVKGPQALALAGRIADGVLLSVLSAPAYVEWAAKQTAGSLPLGAYVLFACHLDGAQARDMVRPVVATFLGVHGEHAITRVAGLDPQLASAFRTGWITGATRVDLVDDDLVRTFAVAGDPDDCAAGIRRFADAGLQTLVIRDDGRANPERLLDNAQACFGLANP
jgi:5,10-methylenetetrahydromethanopterin reductase